MTEMTANQEWGPVLYGVVRFAPGGDRQVLDAVIMFASAAAADSYAVEQGWPDYEVAPVRFFVHERRSALDALPPPARSSLAAPPSGMPAGGRPRTGGPALTKQGHLHSPGDAAADERVADGPESGTESPGEAGETGGAADAGAGAGDIDAGPSPIGPRAGSIGPRAGLAGPPSGLIGPRAGPVGPRSGPVGAVPAAPGPTPGPIGLGGDPSGSVSVVPWGLDRWAVAVAVGADAVDVFRAFGRLPAGLAFSAAYGDVDIVLVHSRIQGSPAAPWLPGSVGPPGSLGPPGALRRSRPVSVAESILQVGSDRVEETRWMTAGERDAYRAGHAEALDAVRRALVRSPPDRPVTRRR